MNSFDVVLIGGGIVGASIAWHLTAAGCKSVLILERESAQGKGSTGKSMGGVRAQFSTPVNVQMSLYSIPFYASFHEHTGEESGYRPQGYLFCATSDKPSMHAIDVDDTKVCISPPGCGPDLLATTIVLKERGLNIPDVNFVENPNVPAPVVLDEQVVRISRH